MRRIGLAVVVMVGLVLGPLAVETGVPRIAILWTSQPTTGPDPIDGFRQGLRELGYVEGQSVIVEDRGVEKVEQLPDVAAELVRRRPDVIVSSSNAAIAALKQATQTTPIVAAVFGSPVGSGLIASLARPGGNITGLSTNSEEISAKWLELLKQTVPNLSRVAVLGLPITTPCYRNIRQGMESAAQTLGVTAQFLEVGGRDDVTRAFATLTRARAGALIAMPGAVSVSHRRLIVDLARKHRLPGMYPFPMFVEEGGLMSYGPNTRDMWRRAAIYVDKILKGAKPADLPVEQPTKFDLVINLKTAKGLGLTIPQSVLARADQIIE